MAWHIPISTASNTQIIRLAENDGLYVAKNVTLSTVGNEPVVGIFGGHGGTHDIRIYGTIVGEYYAVLLNLGSSASDIRVLVGKEGHLETLTANYAIQIGGINQYLDNRGTITGPLGGAVFSEGIAGASKTLANTGTISGGTLGVVATTADGETFNINNHGLIEGDRSFLFLGSGTNIITNSGRVVGDVEFSNGADTYNGTSGRLTGSIHGGAGNDTLRGGIDNDKFYGDAGNDALFSGIGNDILSGGEGNDTLVGDTGADYLSGGTGTDRAAYTTAKSGVVVSLANPTINTGDAKGDTYNSIENLTGSNFNDSLFGNSAANAIHGASGNDVIKGYAGNDILTGGAGQDTFNFNSALSATTNVDRITDFNVASDTIQIDDAIFKSIAKTGELLSGYFRSNTTGLAQDANDHIIYEKDTGGLYYDGNGSASGGSVLFATVAAGLDLTNADFLVV